MGSGHKDDTFHKRQRFDDQHVGQQLPGFSTDSKLFGRNAERPKAHAAVDDRHLREQAPLTVPDNDHSLEAGIFFLGIEV